MGRASHGSFHNGKPAVAPSSIQRLRVKEQRIQPVPRRRSVLGIETEIVRSPRAWMGRIVTMTHSRPSIGPAVARTNSSGSALRIPSSLAMLAFRQENGAILAARYLERQPNDPAHHLGSAWPRVAGGIAPDGSRWIVCRRGHGGRLFFAPDVGS